MAARQFWRANGKRARRSSGVIQTRSTRRHEAVNISGAARERRNKSVKRDKEEEEDGGNAYRANKDGRTGRGTDSDTMKRGKVVDARESAASHCEPSSTLPFPSRAFHLVLILLLLPLLQERFISRRDTTERQVTTSNCRISGCHLSRSNGFRSSRRSNATAVAGKREGTVERDDFLAPVQK